MRAGDSFLLFVTAIAVVGLVFHHSVIGGVFLIVMWFIAIGINLQEGKYD